MEEGFLRNQQTINMMISDRPTGAGIVTINPYRYMSFVHLHFSCRFSQKLYLYGNCPILPSHVCAHRGRDVKVMMRERPSCEVGQIQQFFRNLSEKYNHSQSLILSLLNLKPSHNPSTLWELFKTSGCKGKFNHLI